MTTKTYHGSCHCGAVRFEVDVDLAQGTTRCNCSFCSKNRSWGTNVKPEQFRLIAGRDDLSDYQFGTKSGHHRFCKHCGIRVFGDANVEALGGEIVSIAISTLDDASPAELMAAPMAFCDGRNNAWWETPAEIRHM